MKLDGLGNIDVETVIGIIEQIDLDHSGDIQETELVAWIEQTQSRSEKALAALKILLGLGQVMSKLPEVLKNDVLKHAGLLIFQNYVFEHFKVQYFLKNGVLKDAWLLIFSKRNF